MAAPVSITFADCMSARLHSPVAKCKSRGVSRRPAGMATLPKG